MKLNDTRMSMKKQHKEYIATFILDTRQWREPIEALIKQIQSVITEMGAEILDVTDLGMKPLARPPRKDFIEAQYISIRCKGESSFNRVLQERIGLNPNVNRVMVESVK